MMNYKALFVSLLTSCILSIDRASASDMEEIVGSYPALQSNFKYQSAIVGKYNSSYHHHLLCGACILNNYLILSAARCFLVSQNTLRKFSFFVALGVDVLINVDNILKEIKEIYRYYRGNIRYHNDLAVSKLKESLDLQNNPNLAPLEIPDKDEKFDGLTGVVSGFGIYMSNDLNKGPNREQIRFTSDKGLFLRQANVTIETDGPSGKFYNDTFGYRVPTCRNVVSRISEICARILPDESYEHRGICMGDNGAPLVVDNKVVGIVNMHNEDCDDTIYGTLYTKVTHFREFIVALKHERLSNVYVYKNPPYITKAKRKLSDINTSEN